MASRRGRPRPPGLQVDGSDPRRPHPCTPAACEERGSHDRGRGPPPGCPHPPQPTRCLPACGFSGDHCAWLEGPGSCLPRCGPRCRPPWRACSCTAWVWPGRPPFLPRLGTPRLGDSRRPVPRARGRRVGSAPALRTDWLERDARWPPTPGVQGAPYLRSRVGAEAELSGPRCGGGRLEGTRRARPGCGEDSCRSRTGKNGPRSSGLGDPV